MGNTMQANRIRDEPPLDVSKPETQKTKEPIAKHITGSPHFYNTKLLQKSEMRKVIVIELSYKGFS